MGDIQYCTKRAGLRMDSCANYTSFSALMAGRAGRSSLMAGIHGFFMSDHFSEECEW